MRLHSEARLEGSRRLMKTLQLQLAVAGKARAAETGGREGFAVAVYAELI